MKFEEWLSQQNGVIEVDCGCVTTEAFYHWLRVAYEAGNSPVTPDGSAVTALTGIPMIPDGYVMVPKEPTEAMMLHNSGCQHHTWDDPDCAMRQTRRLIWSHMLAAAPQEVK
ncbi:hypothetical protein OE279_29050 [Klebsiella quasipneumoniae]|uniref:hypothetical protein n=1 Tax=Klebsiella quasipneumoniae TaxID=1463165 RepID=UPI0021D9DFDC|nr:hypothetical protein [Klebsiella quasipneumoniae]MCU8819342.1 hypothetical protein [Klebsiella quasipneumoniae]